MGHGHAGEHNDPFDRIAQRCNESHMDECGGWSAEDWNQFKRYKIALAATARASMRNSSSPRIHMEDKLAKHSHGGLFCFSVVMNPPEPTFDLARGVTAQCDGYLFFSNFSDTVRDIKQVVFGPMSVDSGGQWRTALTTPIFLPVYRYIATHLADKFEWFVKVDTDTLYEPMRLKSLLSRYDHTKPAEMEGPRGPMAILSQGAFQHYMQHVDECEAVVAAYYPQEDLYISQAAWKFNLPVGTDCSFAPQTIAWETWANLIPYGMCLGGEPESALTAEMPGLYIRHKSDTAGGPKDMPKAELLQLLNPSYSMRAVVGSGGGAAAARRIPCQVSRLRL
jgi:hypothetical protein